MLPPIIDSHVHWRDPINNRYEMLSDGVAEDGGRGGAEADVYLPQDYLGDAKGFSLEGVVHIEAEWTKTDPVGETKWLHALAQNDKTGELPIVVVGFADLANANIESVLEAHASMSRTRGIRQILNRVEKQPSLCWADREYLNDQTWRTNYALLAKHGLDFDLMCFAHQLHPMAKLASKHPNVPVHLEHAALPWDHSADGRAAWHAGMKALAELEHADVKISGLGNTIPNWNTDNIRRYVLETIDIFGVDRVSFASNFPTDRQFSDMATIWNAFDEITSEFSQHERQKMFADNARRIYRFDALS